MYTSKMLFPGLKSLHMSFYLRIFKNDLEISTYSKACSLTIVVSYLGILHKTGSSKVFNVWSASKLTIAQEIRWFSRLGSAVVHLLSAPLLLWYIYFLFYTVYFLPRRGSCLKVFTELKVFILNTVYLFEKAR